MTKALYLAALTLTLTACAATHVSSAAAQGSEAWRLAPKANFARLGAVSKRGTTSSVALRAPLEAWQLAARPNAARLSQLGKAPLRFPGQLASISRVNKAMP